MIRHKCFSSRTSESTTKRFGFYSIWRGSWRCTLPTFLSVFGGHIDLLIYSIIHQIILSNKQSQGRNYNILLVWQAELTSVILVLKPQISVASVIRSDTHIHSVNAPILRDTSKKPQVSKSQYSSFFFFFVFFGFK